MSKEPRELNREAIPDDYRPRHVRVPKPQTEPPRRWEPRPINLEATKMELMLITIALKAPIAVVKNIAGAVGIRYFDFCMHLNTRRKQLLTDLEDTRCSISSSNAEEQSSVPSSSSTGSSTE